LKWGPEKFLKNFPVRESRRKCAGEKKIFKTSNRFLPIKTIRETIFKSLCRTQSIGEITKIDLKIFGFLILKNAEEKKSILD